MKLTTSFNKLKLAGACGQSVGSNRGYDKLSTFLGGADTYGKDEEINLLTILESNGFVDAVWCLRATNEEADALKRLMACNFAESVLHIFESKHPEDMRPRKAIEAARNYANGTGTSDQMCAAACAASLAACATVSAAKLAAWAATTAAISQVATGLLVADASYDAYDAAVFAVAVFENAPATHLAKTAELTAIFKKYISAT